MQNTAKQVQQTNTTTDERYVSQESDREAQRELTALELSLVGGGQGVMVFL